MSNNTWLGGSVIFEELADGTTNPVSQSTAEVVRRICKLSAIQWRTD